MTTPLVRQTETLEGFQLASKAEMDTAAGWLAANGYVQGNVTWYIEGGSYKWQLSFADTHGTSQTGYVGDWIVLQNGARATVYSQAVAESLFTVQGG